MRVGLGMLVNNQGVRVIAKLGDAGKGNTKARDPSQGDDGKKVKSIPTWYRYTPTIPRSGE